MLEEKVRRIEEHETKRHRSEQQRRRAPPQYDRETLSRSLSPPQAFRSTEALFLPIQPAKTTSQVASGAIMFRTPKPKTMLRKPPSSVTTQAWKAIGFGESDSDSD